MSENKESKKTNVKNQIKNISNYMESSAVAKYRALLIEPEENEL